MKESRHRRPYIAGFYLYEMSKKKADLYIEKAAQQLSGAGSWNRLTAKEQKESYWSDENIPKSV